MIDDADEPLEGDIGPAARARATEAPQADEKPSAAEALRRYEAEREERRKRTNAVAGRVTLWLAALLLAFLTYDSAATAVEAHGKGDPWLYPPAAIAAACGLALIVLVGWALRRRG
ncbi:hypothetical protein [Actinomadura hibisca]|uniref:hypothetical protein n=1 Tax=Actinomadura hibisca TaxID=68565 RepID=UPI00082E5F6F|nr:hypothetical protein [Actinomadura hibisca]